MTGYARPARGLALPGTLLLLVLLALAMAAAQRGAALQWRAARWECTRLQAREDAWGALRAAQAWVDSQGARLKVQDCTGTRGPAGPRACAQAPGTPGDASWTLAEPALLACTQPCGYHVQAFAAAGAALPEALRLSAWADGPAQSLLQLDLRARPASAAGPRYVVRAWRVLR